MQTVGAAREGFARAEAAQRTFLLTGAPRYIQEREEWTERVLAALTAIGMLTADNPPQGRRVEILAEAMRDRATIARQVAAARQKAGLAGLTPAQLSLGEDVTDRFHAVVNAIQDEERRLLTRRQAIALERQGMTSWAIGGSFGLFLLVLLPAYAGVRYQVRRRELLERQMTELVEQLPVTVWQLTTRPGAAANYLYVGPNALRDRGFTPEDLRSDSQLVFSNVLPEDRELLRSATARAKQEGDAFACEYRVRMPEGSLRWIRASAALRRLPDGSIRWTGYWADISAQKELEQALQAATDDANRANRAKSNFLATMSHEIRTPMNGVLGLLELLDLSGLDAEQRATLSVVSESGRSLLRIIDDILDFSKVEAGRLQLDPVPASVRRVVERACQVHSGIASSRGLLLQQQVDSRIGEVLVFDPLRLGQILNNFISNAVKFTPQGGVTLSVCLLEREEGRERLRFTVTDTGIGIASEAVASLFEPFAQADVRTTARFGGTGLGLSICRHLAALMGGSVSLTSQEGAGTSVTLEVAFPVASAEEVRESAEGNGSAERLGERMATRRMAPSASDAEAEGRLVLVVDDHPTNRLVLSRQVVALGYGVVMAEHGRQALEIWERRHVALVLTDCNMPELDGYDLARAIREREQRERRARVPIVACTANALDGEGARCLAAGMDDILIKPVNLVDLMARLDQWLPLPEEDQAPRPAATAGGDTDAVDLDESVLGGATGGDAALLRELLQDFRALNDADLDRVAAAVARGEPEPALADLHRIKGAARAVGAGRLAHACEGLEEALRAGDAEAVDHRSLALREAAAALNERIDNWTRRGTP